MGTEMSLAQSKVARLTLQGVSRTYQEGRRRVEALAPIDP